MPIPTKDQWVSYPMSSSVAPSVVHVYTANPTAAGDTIFVVGRVGAGSDVISTIVDDQSNTWVKDKTQSDVGNATTVHILRASNVAADTRKITITLSAGTQFTIFSVMVCNNIQTTTPVRTSSSANTSGTTIASGNITVQAGDFVIQYAANCGAGTLSNPTTYTPGSGFTLFAPDPICEHIGQYAYQAGGSTFNPTVTTSRSWSAAVTASVAYITATAGGAQSSNVEIRQIQMVNMNNPFITDSLGTSLTFQFPCDSADSLNTIVVGIEDASNVYSSLSSSPSNTWSSTTKTASQNMRFVYATSATVSATGTITIVMSGAPTLSTNPMMVTVWGLANSGGFDTTQNGSGTFAFPSGTINNVLTTALTTSQANEVILFLQQEESETVTTVASTVGTALPLMPDTGLYEFLDLTMDAGKAHVYAASATAYNFNVTYSAYEAGAPNVGPWSATAIAFKTAAGGGPTVQAVPTMRTPNIFIT